MRNALWAGAVLLIVAPASVCGEECVGCHRNIWETYQRTGMARSFYRPSPANTVEDYTKSNTFYHKPSDSYFTMLRHDDKFYQRRYQMDADSKQINVMEKQVDYVMGSGNHSRAYLNRTARGTLIELPLAWYSEKGGYWGMNPGYDRPVHDGFRREIAYDCMFCHNAYPEIPAGNEKPFSEAIYEGPLPEGIDCQRCHGSGDKHVRLATTVGATQKDIRAAIVNPSRLNADRQLEVCMQCHLETTSFPLPNSIQRFDRGPFSYRPGEPLAGFLLAFDHAPGNRRDDKYEIVNAAYRLRRSACFLQSKGELKCTTCHNPHDIPRGQDATAKYTAACRQCHTGAFNRLVASGKHPTAANCTDCHMPKRRTEDVVHVVMTDHYIQRRKPAGDSLAEIAERHETDADAYKGPVVPYYPRNIDDLYLSLAQVIQKSNLSAGIVQFTAAIAKFRPLQPEFYFELGDALRESGQAEKAMAAYQQAIRRDPDSVVARQKLAVTLRRSKRPAEAVEVLKQAAAQAPKNPAIWREFGLAYAAVAGNEAKAITALQRALELDPDMAEVHNNLGAIWSAKGETARAETAYREAIRIQPDYADAHSNLGSLLSSTGDLKQAGNQFEIALRLSPEDAVTRYSYAMVLGRNRRFNEAQSELERALRDNPDFAEAHQLLGDLLMAKEQTLAALSHYREALRIQPLSGRADLSLASALAATGDLASALTHLQKAAAATDPAVREEAAAILRQLKR